MKKFWDKAGFLLAVLLLFLALDLGLRASGWVQNSGYFAPDDFEITRRDHPEPVWDGVIYGSSELISGYREELSETGYVNLGMDYATVEDLCQLLEGGYIQVRGELILAVNWCLVWDDLDTDPTYIWHKGPLEPWVYFQRGRLFSLVRDDVRALLHGQPLRQATHGDDRKEIYRGHMSDAEHEARMERLNSLYFSHGKAGYDGNLAALEQLLDWCEKHELPVRAFWLPENPARSLGPVNDEVHAACEALFARRGMELYDMKDFFGAECFYDTGHFEYDEGAPLFTKELDKWILSSKSGKP